MKQVRTELIQLNSRDNVAVAAKPLLSGQEIAACDVVCKGDIPAGHKVAILTIAKDAPVFKYGSMIGYALTDIHKGEHVHSHNIYMETVDREYRVGSASRPTRFIDPARRATFEGFVRSDGKVGTRNYIGVLSTVNCSAGVSHFIARAANEKWFGSGGCGDVASPSPLCEGIDGVVGVTHGAGCCMTIGGEGLALLQQTLAGFAANPNFGGILVVGLGCEVNLVSTFMETMKLTEGPCLKTLNIQDLGGTRETVARGLEVIETMLPRVGAARRETVSAEHLTLALECGGSDAYSGISSNPALGAAADKVVENGGTVILAETPEIYGAEHLLIQRAQTPETAEKLIARIKWWEAYTHKHQAEINNNPTPGNKAGGLTTILEKSLGAVAKAGSTNLMDVFTYARPVTTRGMVFMDTPGYDIVSITGMIAGGANLVCFTTGRGTVVGFKPVPTLKLSSNTPMYERLREDMDINCGPVLDQGVTVAAMGDRIFSVLLETASGKLTRSEQLGFGDHEFVPWHMGAVL